MSIELRPYQQDLFEKTRAEFAKGKRRVIDQLPCGGGKTPLFLKMADDTVKRNPDGYVLILSHRLELIDQAQASIERFGLDSSRIRIASVFTEARHLGEYEKPSLLILDESHLAKAASWERVIEYYDTWTIGVSATPCRLDSRPLGDIFQSMVVGISHKELEAMGRLAPYDYYAPVAADVSKVSKRGGDFATDELESIVCTGTIYGNVLESWRKFAEGRRTIAYCVSVKHSKEIAELFNANGVEAASLDGSMSKSERSEIMRRFRAGKITLLSSCAILSEGLDIPEISCGLLLRPTQSCALYVQQSCRPLRANPNDPNKRAVIIDCVGNYLFHGLPSDDREWSLDAPPKAHKEFNDDGTLTVRVCPRCFKTYKTPASVCPYCGEPYELTPREMKKMEEIELKRIEAAQFEAEQKRKNKVKQDIRNARSFEDFLRIQKEQGYASGWAIIRAKARGYKF